MGTLTFKIQTSGTVPLPSADQVRLFVDSSDSILKTVDSTGTIRPSGVGTASELATTGGSPVDISGSVPPSAGQILIATGPNAAAWGDPAAAAAAELVTTGAPVDVSGSAPPSAGQLLIATGPSSAVWSDAGPASLLTTTGGPIDLSTADPPAIGDVLTATSPTTAAWQAPTGGGGGGLTPTAILGLPDSNNWYYQAAVGDLVPCDLSTFSNDYCEVDLPEFHSAGDQVGVKMVTVANGNWIEVWPFNINTSQIDGENYMLLTTDYEWAIFMSDGTNWMQIG